MKLTVKQIEIKLKKKNLLLKSKYKDAHSKIKVSCIKCKEGKKAYKITAQQAWDRGCKFCNLKNLYKILEKKVYSKRRITNKEFKKLLHSELKSHTTYINNDTHLIIECLRCGNKKPTIPLHLLDGKHHCNICGPKKGRTFVGKSSNSIRYLEAGSQCENSSHCDGSIAPAIHNRGNAKIKTRHIPFINKG